MINLTNLSFYPGADAALQAAFIQESIMNAYKGPLILVVCLLVLLSVILAYHAHLARFLARDKYFLKKMITEDRIKIEVLRVVLWGLVTSTMVVAGLLFLKIEIVIPGIA